MGLGDWIKRVSEGAGASIDEARYRRDWGPNYKERFAAEQSYLDRLADEKEDQRQRQKQAEDRAERLFKIQEAEEARAAKAAEARRFDTGVEGILATGIPQVEGPPLFNGDPVALGLAQNAEEGMRMLGVARARGNAARAGADETRRLKERDTQSAHEWAKELAAYTAGLHKPKGPTAPDADALLKGYRDQARQLISGWVSSQGLNKPDMTYQQYEKLVEDKARELAGGDARVGPVLQKRELSSSFDNLNDLLVRGLRGEDVSAMVAPAADPATRAVTRAAAPGPGNDGWTTLPNGVRVRKKS